MVGHHEEGKEVDMTTHELAKKLLEMRNVEVRVWDTVGHYDPNICVEIRDANQVRDLSHKLIDHEFVSIW